MPAIQQKYNVLQQKGFDDGNRLCFPSCPIVRVGMKIHSLIRKPEAYHGRNGALETGICRGEPILNLPAPRMADPTGIGESLESGRCHSPGIMTPPPSHPFKCANMKNPRRTHYWRPDSAWEASSAHFLTCNGSRYRRRFFS